MTRYCISEHFELKLDKCKRLSNESQITSHNHNIVLNLFECLKTIFLSNLS